MFSTFLEDLEKGKPASDRCDLTKAESNTAARDHYQPFAVVHDAFSCGWSFTTVLSDLWSLKMDVNSFHKNDCAITD